MPAVIFLMEGLTRTLSYQQLAAWLTEIGAPTKVSEPSSARSKPLLLGVAPRTPEVMDLWQRLQERFPEADLAPLLADEDDGCGSDPSHLRGMGV